MSYHIIPTICLFTTFVSTFVDVITSVSLLVCAVTEFEYISPGRLLFVFIVISISIFVLGSISPFNANTVTASPISVPICFSFQIPPSSSTTPIPSSFGVIFLASISVVVYSFKLSVSTSSPPDVCVTFTFSSVYVPLYAVPLPSPLYGKMSNNWKSGIV